MGQKKRISLNCLPCQEQGKVSVVCSVEEEGWLVEFRQGDPISLKEQTFQCPECKREYRVVSEPDYLIGTA